MVDIEPLKHRESTNIDEHNQMVSKINEIAVVLSDLNVDTINNEINEIKNNVSTLNQNVDQIEVTVEDNTDHLTNVDSSIDTINSNVGRIDNTLSQVEISLNENTDHITTIDSTLDNHARNIKTNSDAIEVIEPKVETLQSDVGTLKSNVTRLTSTTDTLNTEVKALNTNVEALNKELPTEFRLYRSGSGKIQLQCEREDSSVLDSNILDMIIPESFDIVSGTTNRSFKLEITFSDGSTGKTNDFVIPEGGGTDVTITGISLIKVTDNTFKTRINLSDGTPIDSGTLTTVNSVSGVFANKQLTITVNGISSVPIGIDTGITYTGGNGIKIASGVISIDTSVVALKSEIADMETKTNASATYAAKTAIADMETKTNANATFATKAALASTDTKVTQIQNIVADCFNEVGYDPTSNKMTLTALDGQSSEVPLDKNWGSENAGKILGIDSDGMVSPVDTGDSSNGWQYDTLQNILNKTFANNEILQIKGSIHKYEPKESIWKFEFSIYYFVDLDGFNGASNFIAGYCSNGGFGTIGWDGLITNYTTDTDSINFSGLQLKTSNIVTNVSRSFPLSTSVWYNIIK